MAIIELLIGISIGFALGIIIMIISESKEEQDWQDTVSCHEEMDEQIHESGFIDIPLHHLVFEPKKKNIKDTSLKKRIERFKLRNRFYK